MVWAWLKNRRKVNSADSQILKIAETFGYSADISAVNVVPLRIWKISPFSEFFILGRIRWTAKAVWHNLIPNGVLYPVRRSYNVGNIQPRVLEVLHWSQAVLLDAANFIFAHNKGISLAFKLKVIPQTLIPRLQLNRPYNMVFKLCKLMHFGFNTAPMRLSAKLVYKRILADNKRAVNVLCGFYIYRNGVFVRRVAIFNSRSVRNCGNIHSSPPWPNWLLYILSHRLKNSK